MTFGNRFIDLGVGSPEEVLISKNKDDRWDRAQELRFGADNATRLARRLAAITNSTPHTVLYLPEGRYYLSFREGLPEVISEQGADFLIPFNVTLRFGPGATLVPMALTLDEARARGPAAFGVFLARRQRLPTAEQLRVRVEVQGVIDAPVTKIFDPYMEEDVNPVVMPRRPGGLVVFQKTSGVREVYPEWWGALPLRGEERTHTEAEARRTTAALQAAIDAAFNHRVTQPQDAYNPAPEAYPPLPVVLLNDYAIDRPLRVGMTLLQARAMGRREDAFPPNARGFVLRGECGPATRRGGAALIKASQWFRSENVPPGETVPPAPVEEYGDSRSLLTVRSIEPCTVQNVVFDAADIAERCVTVMGLISTHHNGFDGCEFRNAKHALLYLGGELPPAERLRFERDLGRPAGTSSGALSVREPIADIVRSRLGTQLGTRYFSNGQDVSDLRVTRCRFLTGTGAGVTLPIVPFRKGVFRSPMETARWKHAVVFRSEQGLGVEFSGCTFEGQGSPMVLLLGGRLSFQNCFFRTDLVPGALSPSTSFAPDQVNLRSWNGTDIHLGAPYMEGTYSPTMPTRIQPFTASSLTARNIESRSRQFLTTYPALQQLMPVNGIAFGSVTLIQVRHKSDFTVAGGAPVRPAIYWAGPRWRECPLLLQDCLFATPEGTNPPGVVFVASSVDGMPPTWPRPVFLAGTRRVGGGELLFGTVAAVIPAVMTIPT